MPSIVVTPKYNPFTFDELYRPLAETTKMQMALEDQYNAMEMEAAKLDYLKDSDKDAYAIVKNYEDTLRGLAGELASNGLTPQSRQGVYDMRKMYSSDVEPINKYVAWKDAQAKSRQAMRDKDSTYMWEMPLEAVKYNTWRNNPNMVFQGASGEALTKSVSEQVKNIAKRYQENPEGLQISDLGKDASYLNGLIGILQEYGASRDQILGYMRKNNLTEEQQRKLLGTLQPLFDEAIDNTRKSFGIDKWSNQDAIQDWFNGSVNAGLWSAIGVDQFGMQHKPSDGKGSGGGSPWEISEGNHKWDWLTKNRNPSFISNYGDALWVGNNLKRGINNFIDYASAISNAFNRFGHDNRIQNAFHYDASTSGFNEFIKNTMGNQIPVNPADFSSALKNSLKMSGIGFSTDDTGFSIDFTGDTFRKEYKKFIDDELKKKDSKIIREIEGNERDTITKYGHKVNVPAVIALAKELDDVGNDETKRNMILQKYASMPLDRMAEVEIIDTDAYKPVYNVQDITDFLGGNKVAENKISNAYNTLKDFMDKDSDDAAAFGLHYYDGIYDDLKQALLHSYSKDRKGGETTMRTYDYVWDEEAKDFKSQETEEGISFEDIDKAKNIELEYSERGLFFNILTEKGEEVKVRYKPYGGVANNINNTLKKIHTITDKIKGITNKLPEEITEEDTKVYNLGILEIKGLYNIIDNIIANDLRKVEATKDKK